MTSVRQKGGRRGDERTLKTAHNYAEQRVFLLTGTLKAGDLKFLKQLLQFFANFTSSFECTEGSGNGMVEQEQALVLPRAACQVSVC